MEADAALEQRTDAHSGESSALTLHRVDKPRPEGNQIQFITIFIAGDKPQNYCKKRLRKYSYTSCC